MKIHALLSLLAIGTASVLAQAAAPTPITTADVPNSISATIPAALKVGIVTAYNQAVAAEYAALTSAQQATYTPPTVNAYMMARIADLFKGYTRATYDADFDATKLRDKWQDLTQAQRDAIKATAATIP
jgi:hypothetical protein